MNSSLRRMTLSKFTGYTLMILVVMQAVKGTQVGTQTRDYLEYWKELLFTFEDEFRAGDYEIEEIADWIWNEEEYKKLRVSYGIVDRSIPGNCEFQRHERYALLLVAHLVGEIEHQPSVGSMLNTKREPSPQCSAAVKAGDRLFQKLCKMSDRAPEWNNMSKVLEKFLQRNRRVQNDTIRESMLAFLKQRAREVLPGTHKAIKNQRKQANRRARHKSKDTSKKPQQKMSGPWEKLLDEYENRCLARSFRYKDLTPEIKNRNSYVRFCKRNQDYVDSKKNAKSVINQANYLTKLFGFLILETQKNRLYEKICQKSKHMPRWKDFRISKVFHPRLIRSKFLKVKDDYLRNGAFEFIRDELENGIKKAWEAQCQCEIRKETDTIRFMQEKFSEREQATDAKLNTVMTVKPEASIAVEPIGNEI